jgi:hypothetical protein
MDRFSLPKLAGTHADVLAAAGLADLLSPVVDRCVIVDLGPDFCVEVGATITPDICADLPVEPGYRFLRPNEKASVPEAVKRDYVDYPAEKARAARYNTARLEARRAGAELAADIAADKPRPDWRLYQALNALQGDDATNKLALAILKEAPDSFARTVCTAIEALRAGRRTVTKWPVALVQLFNPQAAKGYARLKPDSTDRNDGTKNAFAEPFLEWLRYRGYFAIACPYFLGAKGDSVRLLCPVPQHVDFLMLTDAVGKLRALPAGGSAPKLDSLSVLNLAEILVQGSKQFQEGGFAPVQLVSGIMIANYQSMGQAKAVTGLEQLALPDWFPIHTQADSELWLEILAEHRVIIRSLRDDRSDEIGLLLKYRRYLEKRGKAALMCLACFFQDYGIFLLREREHGRRLKQLQTVHMEKIFMQGQDYSGILSNQGFRAVADAIRSATVSAQAMKAMKRPDYREIRYNLLPELRRKRTLPGVGPFLDALGEFVASYNGESARRLELGKRTGIRRVTTDELSAFVELACRQEDASVIGALLCAYATCREPRQSASDVEPNIPEEPVEESSVEA